MKKILISKVTMMGDIDSKVIESFKFLGGMATQIAVQEDKQVFSFSQEFNNAISYELLSLINNNPDMREHFFECIKIFIGIPWIDRTKPRVISDDEIPCNVAEFLLYVLQWEELYLHVEYLVTQIPVEEYIFHRELQAYRSCFRSGWDNEDLYEDFDFANYRKTRNIDVSWKEKYKEFNK